ncbi:lipocalin-like domain-containing protein [Robertkochia flava]|uniref:lipocalin family protein n=1 Tax=Robertkochia flava TaxID=3447986 RepID=UPI001CCCDCC6|nr:lipocalin family protein [Robertkochia marina]
MTDLWKLVVLALFICISCESEDDASEITGTLDGTWKLEARIYDGSRESLTECEMMQTVTFSGEESLSMYWLEIPPCEFSGYTGTYILNGEQLSVTLPEWPDSNGAFISNYKVLLLSESDLRVELLNDSERGDYPDEEKTILIFEKESPAS